MTEAAGEGGHGVKIKFDDRGLIPAVVTDRSGQVLMVAYMNQESLDKTLDTGYTWFYSRSRGRLWQKGETSGHLQKVIDIRTDCDQDTLLVTVDQIGAACHEGDYTCFHYDLKGERVAAEPGSAGPGGTARGGDAAGGAPAGNWRGLAELEELIRRRKAEMPEGSYTTKLFSRAPDLICKKIGEEATEVVLASKNGDLDNLRYEAADLLYHTLVLLAHHGLGLDDVVRELGSRRK